MIPRPARRGTGRVVTRSGQQLLGVTWSGLHDLGSDRSARGVKNRDGVSRLFIASAPNARPLLPIRAIRIALDFPFAMQHVSAGRLVEGRSILAPTILRPPRRRQ